MSNESETIVRLREENEDLRSRLEEAEETLLAIRRGEVDALVVSGEGGDRIFTLTGADHPYRVLIEEMSEGAITLTTGGVILYANRRFAEMVDCPLAQVIGSSLREWIVADDESVLQALLRMTDDGRRSAELSLQTRDGETLPAHLSMNILPMEGVLAIFCMVITDLTDQKRNESIVASERLARSILEQVAETIVVCDVSGCIIRASCAAQMLLGHGSARPAG